MFMHTLCRKFSVHLGFKSPKLTYTSTARPCSHPYSEVQGAAKSEQSMIQASAQMPNPSKEARNQKYIKRPRHNSKE
eukprot:2120777-Amphidinium_carterae.2